jgi:gliding motility-associated-like protein
VRNSFLNLKIVIIFCISFFSKDIHAQLGFCQGNSGDPIFTETFGTGTTYGPALPGGTTTYNIVYNSGPQDGQYTIGRNTFSYGWNLPSDHTPNDTNGKALIVNASFTAGEFYKTTINGLCENTTYEFSSWVINILPSSGCGGNSIPVNVKFEIWDITDTNLLASGNTGNIVATSTPTWNQYGLVFQTVVGQTSVILKMKNNGVGGCGNDLAIDDIVFRSCGDSIVVDDGTNNNSVTICSSQTPFSETITATPDNVVFNNHFYQWQSSSDGINWTDSIGETNASINVTGLTSTTYYRAKVAEFAANLNNSDCITFSDVFEIIVNQAPAQPTTECWETATIDNATCSWSISGTQPLAPTLACWETATFNTTNCAWEVTGTQPVQPTLECWEIATFNNATCVWDITGTQPGVPTGLDCWEIATFNITNCAWDITGTQPASPTGLDCWEIATFNNTTCIWDITGTQPVQPTLECWEIATFNNTTCVWDVTGTQPAAPTGLDCWEITSFNDTTCSWDVTGSQPVQPTLECWETTTFSFVSCSWVVSGTQPASPTGLDCWEIATFNDTTCSWEVSGTQPVQPALECWQTATFNDMTCVWDVIGTQPINFIEEFIIFCEGDEVVMQADSDLVSPSYQWNTGETNEFKTVDIAGTYIVTITDGCSTIEKTINVEQIPIPIIESVVSDGSAIIVNMTNSGDFEYSLDGILFQSSPNFPSVDGGPYTIYVKAGDCESVVTMDHFHFYIPKFITPNSDSVNDVFTLRGIEYFESSEVSIYNRYGKLLYQVKNASPFWDGTLNNKDLPTNDYWYVIIIEGQKITGHFTLKR